MAIVASGQITLTDLNDSKQLQLFIGSNQPKTQIFNPNNSVYTPNWTTQKPVLTPQLFVAGTSDDIIASAKSIKWFEGSSATAIVSNTNYTVGTTGAKALTINTNILSSKDSQLFVCEVVYTDPATGFDVIAKADFEFAKVTNGQKGDTGEAGANAITAVLSNDAHNVPTDPSGANGVFGGANSTITIYEGATDVTASWTVAQTRTAVTVTEATSSKTATVTALSADTGSVTFTATRSGYATIVKTFTLTKVKQGVTGGIGGVGQSATAYWLIGSAGAIQKTLAGAYTPSAITFTGKAQTGTANPVDYAGRWIISESTNGTTFVDKVTSTANEATKSHTPSAGIVAVRARLYLAGGVTNLIDEEIIPVVSDGATGATGEDAVTAVVWTPDGNTLRNSEGTLTAKIDVYKGSTLVTPTAIKWYAQDSTATTSSGGDADGGAGWRLMTSTVNQGTTGFTTHTLTIPSQAIAGLESFMAIATYGGKKYRDVCTVIDVTDPITVTVIGANTLKNGEGNTTLTAKLYRNGDEIDSAGTAYVYSWSLYNANNTKNTPFGTKTGKSVVVNATDFVARANLVCEVSPK